jgi:hypothetical protein
VMTLRKNLAKIAAQWPVAMIALGIVLTLVWLGALIWLSMHVLDFV